MPTPCTGPLLVSVLGQCQCSGAPEEGCACGGGWYGVSNLWHSSIVPSIVQVCIMGSTARASDDAMGDSRPRSNQTTVSLNFDDPNSLSPHPRINFNITECIETKTITTTTTTKRAYPPLFVRETRPLLSLDSKEYPLAQKPTPPELASFSFHLDRHDLLPWSQVDKDAAALERQGVRFTRPSRLQMSHSLNDATFQSQQSHQSQQSQQSVSDGSTQGSKDEAKDESALVVYPSGSRRKQADGQSQPRPVATRKSNRMASRSASPIVAGAVKKNTHRTASARSFAPSFPHAVTDKLRRAFAHSDRASHCTDLCRMCPVTPDAPEPTSGNGTSGNGTSGSATSGNATSGNGTSGNATGNVAGNGTSAKTGRPLKLRRSNLDSYETPESDQSQPQGFFDISSPSGSDSHTVFSSNVATPPITDADAEPFADVDADESLQQSIRALQPPRPIDTLAAQDASLPSPRLSPTIQVSQMSMAEPDQIDGVVGSGNSDTMHEDSQNSVEEESDPSSVSPTAVVGYDESQSSQPTIMESRTMLETFDAMPAELKSFMMYQFLRRCSRKTLHLVADVVNPALKCDILKDLPMELTLHVLSYLDHRDLCRAAQVSKHWRGVIDSNETGWKELFDRDGFTLASGELDRAIREGWGWQDPVGPEGCERDYSLQNRLTSTEIELRSTSKSGSPAQKSRFSKRKRALNYAGAERSKRRASAQDTHAHMVKEERTWAQGAKTHKSEGPISAANSAAVAVQDPHIGLPSLRRLHLFKSLYRRHYMIRKSWTSGKVKPGHVAFAAHPRHVITCLQFDEDKIITGSDDMLIHVYDTKTGKLRRRLEGHEGGVWALQYEGNMLVSGSTDRTVRVWDIEKGLCTQVFYGHTSTVRCLQILTPTPTGKVEDGKAVMMPPKPLIITGSRDSQLRVWRLPEVGSRRYIQTGPPANDADCPYFIRTLQGHTHSVRAIAAHADTLVSGSYDNTVRVWKISTGETVHVLQGHTQKVYSVVLDVARNRCISGSMDSFVKIWDLATGACLHTLEGHSLLVGLLDLRDERLVSAAADSTLRIWDPESGRCQSTLTAHTGAITCFQHDGRKVISGSDRTLKMWDIRSGECIQDLLTDLSGVWQVRFDERRCVAAVQRDNLTYIEILDFGAVRDGKPLKELGKRILLNSPEVDQLVEEDG
ncbi:WD40-repeat-containing domain protein [Xylariomycetidae sp. FL0641]|nr:WD40-repeat-containing domain protein [Xylariomycetidae sp. FL0641]